MNETILESIDRAIKREEKELEMMKAQRTLFTEKQPDFPCSFVPGTMPRLVIEDLSFLFKARAFLRSSLGTWTDKLQSRFYSTGRTITTWKNPTLNIEIWLECPIEEYPDPLKKASCGWLHTNTTDYVYTCQLPNTKEGENYD